MNKTFHITTFGCQMNEHDSEVMAGMLTEKGFTEVSERRDAGVAISTPAAFVTMQTKDFSELWVS